MNVNGEKILTTYDDYTNAAYHFVDGTSFSAPYVAGIAALAALAWGPQWVFLASI